MALASFFDKTALSAAAILQGFDRSVFAATLEAHTIGIAFDQHAASSSEGRITLELAVNLLARLYPRLAFITSDDHATNYSRTLAEQARQINPVIDFSDELEQVTAVIAVGDTPVPCKSPVIYVGSRGWSIYLSDNGPVGCGNTGNPFAAAAAACFGAANLFRVLFAGQLPADGGVLDSNRSLSLISFKGDAVSEDGDPLPEIDIGDTSLVGVGAIGNATLWALARLPGLVGNLNLIDPEPIDASNLQRYVLTAAGDIERSKVALGQRAFSGTKLTVQPIASAWADYLRDRSDWQLQNVLVAVDTFKDRQLIQGALPKWLCNAWTQPLDLGISRHARFGEQPCLACLYFDRHTKNEDQIVAEAIGLPSELMAVRQLLYTRAPVPKEFIERIAAANAVAVADLMRFEGQPLRIFYTEAICGGLMMKLGGAGAAATAETPMAFQSVLAGILLAAELTLHASNAKRSELPTTTRINLLRPLADELSVPVARKEGCICGDADYLAAFNAKWTDASV